MNILIACEESQRVCIAFRDRGHNAFSCDLLDCSGGHPEWHIKGDVLSILNPQTHNPPPEKHKIHDLQRRRSRNTRKMGFNHRTPSVYEVM